MLLWLMILLSLVLFLQWWIFYSNIHYYLFSNPKLENKNINSICTINYGTQKWKLVVNDVQWRWFLCEVQYHLMGSKTWNIIYSINPSNVNSCHSILRSISTTKQSMSPFQIKFTLPVFSVRSILSPCNLSIMYYILNIGLTSQYCW